MDIMNLLKKIKIGGLAAAVITIIIGLVLFLNPTEVSINICSLLGWALLAMGVFGGLSCTVFTKQETRSMELAINILEALAGLYIAVRPASIIKFLAKIMAVVLIVHGVNDFSMAFKMKRNHYDKWKYTALAAAVTIGLGILSIVSPFWPTDLLFRIIGASLLFDGGTELFIIHRASNVIKELEPIDTTGEWK